MKEESQSIIKGIFPPPLFVLALLIIGFSLRWYNPLSFQNNHRDYWLFSGIIVIILSGLLAFLASRIMRSQRTPINFDNPTIMIINKGPFRFTRNPLYLSLLMFYGGAGIVANSLWFALLLPVLYFFLRSVILREEKYLDHIFGNEYVLYKNTVKRWL